MNPRDFRSFKDERPNLLNAAIELNELLKLYSTVLLLGQLKVGKSEVFHGLATLRSNSHFIYCLSLLRNDMSDQLEINTLYGIDNLSLGSKTSARIPNFNSDVECIVGRDELEYGDKPGQKYDQLRINHINDNVKWVETSATPMSLMEVVSRNSNIPHVVIRPPPGYNDLNKLRKTVIIDPFCNFSKGKNKHIISLSPAFESAVKDWLKIGNYPIFIVRDTKFPTELKDELQEKIRQLQLHLGYRPKINVKVVHQGNSKDFEWKRDNWDAFELIVVKQTFTRGTGTNVQPFLYGYYDHRNDNTTLATLLQALGRFCGFLNNSHIILFLSKEGVNYVDAYNNMWQSLLNDEPLPQIIDDMNTIYGITKLSDTVTLKSHSLNIGTWQYCINTSPSNNGLSISPLQGNSTNERYLNALCLGIPPGGGYQTNGVCNIIIDDLGTIISQTTSTKCKNLCQQVQQRYNLPLTGKIYFVGNKIGQMSTIITANNKSVYENLNNQGLLC